MKSFYICSLFFCFMTFAMLSCHAENENKKKDPIEIIKEKDSTVVYAERLDNEHAILYRSIYPDVLFFVQISDSILYKIDSIVDFNHEFTVYRTELELKKNMGNITETDADEIDFSKWAVYIFNRKYRLNEPLVGSFVENLFIIDNNSIYEVSLSKRSFNKIIYFYMALDLYENCSDRSVTRIPHPQKSISSSVLRVAFQDSSNFELTPDGSLNVQIVDSNSCLKIDNYSNDIHIKYKKGKECQRKRWICD